MEPQFYAFKLWVREPAAVYFSKLYYLDSIMSMSSVCHWNI